jgi:pimeloyl-ACP methyl ester carboxylesterase
MDNDATNSTSAGDCVATQSVAARDGRALAYCEVGDPNGPLVLHNHGSPSCRLEAHLFADIAAKHHLRFVCVDRPGYGKSSPQQTLSHASWADDLTTIADALGQDQFAVTGWSGGGPAALAAAAYIDPQRLRHVTYIAGACYGAFGDNWAAKQLSKIDALGGTLALHFQPAFRAMYATIGITAEYFRDTYMKQLRQAVNDYDRHVLQPPNVAAAFAEASAECFAQGSDALVRDSELTYRQWAFDVTKIERPVHLWQGTDDTLVPYSINRQLSDRMLGAVWHEVAGAGHFIALGAAEQILAIAADELGA